MLTELQQLQKRWLHLLDRLQLLHSASQKGGPDELCARLVEGDMPEEESTKVSCSLMMWRTLAVLCAVLSAVVLWLEVTNPNPDSGALVRGHQP